MAVIKVGINGFGRIGRRVFRLLLQHPDIEVVAINDIADTKTLSHLLKYDSIHGVLQKKVAYTTDSIKVDQRTYPFYSQTSISKIPWQGVDIVIEATGKFKTKSAVQTHISSGAKKVILCVPPTDDQIKMIVAGVNDSMLTPEDMADPTKLYTALMQNAGKSGVSAKGMLGLQELMNQQVTARKAVETTQSAKDLANQIQLLKVEQSEEKIKNQRKDRTNADFEKLFKTDLAPGSQRLQRLMNSLGLADLDRDKRVMLEEEIKTKLLETYRKEGNQMSMVELLDPVTKAVVGKYDIDMNFIMDDEITLKNTEQKSSDLDTKFSDILSEFEKSKTKK